MLICVSVLTNHLKVLDVGLNLAVELGIAVQIQNIGEGFFHQVSICTTLSDFPTSH